MIPGELFIDDGPIELNVGRRTVTLTVANTGGRFSFCGQFVEISFNQRHLSGKSMGSDITFGSLHFAMTHDGFQENSKPCLNYGFMRRSFLNKVSAKSESNDLRTSYSCSACCISLSDKRSRAKL